MKRLRDNPTVQVYTAFFRIKKARIKRDVPKGGRRFLAYARLFLITPWCLVIRYLRKDWHLIVYFAAWFVIVSCEVWFPYLMGLITWGTDASGWWFGIGSACWLFWAGPGTPFLAIVLALTVGTSAAERAIKRKRKKKIESRKGDDP